MLRYMVVAAPGGAAGVLAGPRGLVRLLLLRESPTRARARIHRDHPEARHDRGVLPDLQRQLRQYFSGKRVAFEAPLDLQELSPFQQRVLRACATIPYGQTRTYGELADELGCPGGARAVGGALASNPVPVVIPCHRVIAGDGSLGGYSGGGGVELKRELLELERQGQN